MNELLSQYLVVEDLENYLGSPENINNIISFANSMELDELESFPEEAIDLLYQWGMNEYYIPITYGGKFFSFESFMNMARVVARRDMTVAISYSTLIWSVIVWIAGNEDQKRKHARFIRGDTSFPCLAYSEENHGADLLAGRLTAERTSGGYIVNGEKWPINRATQSGAVALLAKTGNSGSRCLSLFMLEKNELDKTRFSNLPAVKTLGLRGCDISGIRFENCEVSESDRIGNEGHGLEIALKAFQVTRTLCAALSLGAADTALRATLKFALERKLYGDCVYAIPHAREKLVNAFLDILICDAVATAATRGLHVSTDQFSCWSAVVKVFVPTTIENTMQSLAKILGARYYLREKHQWGIFQKFLRDNAVVGLFDGSTIVNQHYLGLQLRHLSRLRQQGENQHNSEIEVRLKTIFSLNKSLPEFRGEKLDLFGRGRDDVLQGLHLSLEKMEHLVENDKVNQQALHVNITCVKELLNVLAQWDQRALAIKGEDGEYAPDVLRLAHLYSVLHAAASCVHLWVYSRELLDSFFANGEWLTVCLQRLLTELGAAEIKIPANFQDHISDHLLRLHKEHRLFSFSGIQLANEQQIQNSEHSTSDLCA